MRLVKFKLADSPFWFLDNLIRLNQVHKMSDFVNIDSLSDEQKVIVNKSIASGAIKAFDPESNRVKNINDTSYVNGELAISLEDIEEDESDTVPEVFSMTVSNDEEEEEEEEGPTDTDFDNAQLLLDKNGNTVKKALKAIPKTNEGLLLLHACLGLEKSGKNRLGIVSTIEQRIMEF